MGRRNEFADVFKCIDMRPVPPLKCWLWTASVNDKGLPYFTVKGRKYVAYRIVYLLTHPGWDINNRREFIRHKCTDDDGNHVDNPLCCNPDHMETGTHDENMMDMMLRGRKGLTREALEDILDVSRRLPNLTHSQIAARVSHKHQIPVARQTVTDILSGRRRKVLRDAIDLHNKEIDDGGK